MAKTPEEQRAYRRQWEAKNRGKRRAYNRTQYLKNAEKERARAKAYREAHHAVHKMAVRQWKEQHQEHVKQHKAEWNAKHQEHVRAYNAEWQANNHELARHLRREWQKNNPAKKLAADQRRRARKASAPVNDLTATQWDIIKAHYGQRCVYCGRKMQRLEMDHITPLSKGGSHTMSNVVPACKSCNARKNDRNVLKPVQPLLL